MSEQFDVVIQVITDRCLVSQIASILHQQAVRGYLLERSETEIVGRIGQGEMLGAFVGSQLVGVCQFHHWNDSLVEIGALAVLDEYQKHGIGTRLILETTKAAKIAHPKADLFALTDASPREHSPVGPFHHADYLDADKLELPDIVWRWCDLDQCPVRQMFPQCKCRLMLWRNHNH